MTCYTLIMEDQETKRPLSYDRRSFFRIRTVLSVAIGLEKEAKESLPSPMSVDISGGGIGFVTKDDYKVGDVLTLTISLPEKEIIHTKARIVSSRRLQHKNDELRIGAYFFEITQHDREALIRYIMRLQAERLEKHYSA